MTAYEPGINLKLWLGQDGLNHVTKQLHKLESYL